jgi:CBS domain-containing protein
MSTVRSVLENKGRQVYTIRDRSTVDDAVVEMCRVKAGALLAVDPKGRPTGILSERDLLVRVLLAHRDPATTLVRDVMTRGLVCVDEDEPVERALSLMNERRCRHLPVVHDGVVGLVSIGDLVRMAYGEHEHELHVLHDYIEGKYPG